MSALVTSYANRRFDNREESDTKCGEFRGIFHIKYTFLFDMKRHCRRKLWSGTSQYIQSYLAFEVLVLCINMFHRCNRRRTANLCPIKKVKGRRIWTEEKSNHSVSACKSMVRRGNLFCCCKKVGFNYCLQGRSVEMFVYWPRWTLSQYSCGTWILLKHDSLSVCFSFTNKIICLCI